MNLWRIALKNLGRNRSRTMLSFLSIAVGVFVVILTKGLVDGTLNQIMESTIRFSSGHIRVVDQDYLGKEQLLSLNYPVDQSWTEDLAATPGVDVAVPRLRFGGLISRDEESEGIMVTGIEQHSEERLSNMSRYLEGRWMDPGAREAVLGHLLLNRLGLDIGDRFTLVFSSAFGALKGYTFEVVGQLSSGYTYLDDYNVFIDLGLAQGMLEMEGEVTEILLLAEKEDQVASLLTDVRGVLEPTGQLSATPWYSFSELMEYLSMAQRIYVLIYLTIMLLASFVVINTMVMIINERIREIGMLAALGLNSSQIMRLFLYEGGIVGLVGSVAGAVTGGLLNWVLSIVGIAFMDPSAMDAEFFLAPRIYPEFSLWMLVYAVGLGTIVTTLAVLLPSRQAARLEPTRALRGNM